MVSFKLKQIFKIKPKRATKFFLLFLTFLVLIFSGFLSPIIFFSEKIYPNVYIAGQNVGLKTKKEAENLLRQKASRPDKVKLITKDQVFELSLEDIGISYDIPKTVEDAYKIHRSGNAISDMEGFLISPNKSYTLELYVNIDKEKLDEYLQVISQQVAKEPVEPSVGFVEGNAVVNRGVAGETIDRDTFWINLSKKLSLLDFSPMEVPLLKSDHVLTDEEVAEFKQRAENLIGKSLVLDYEYETYLLKDQQILSFINARNKYNDRTLGDFIKKDLVPKVNHEPQNAVFRFEEGKVVEFKPAKPGSIINSELLKNQITEKIAELENSNEKSSTLKIPVTNTPPKISTEEVNNLGIKELLGRGTSKFAGSISGRIHNVGLAASKFNGVLIPPDTVFSFNDTLGDVSVYTGYKQAYVIRDGKTVLGDGGGVCQVSTTFFRAILNAGLPIVERKPHSYRVGYYEQDSGPGLDATVFAPTSDLKFKNDTPSYLLVQTEFDAKKMTLVFEIYGTSDGRVVTLTKPKILSQTAPPPDVYNDDPTLPAGKIVQTEHKAWGAKVSFDYKVVKDGTTLFEKNFLSVYRPWAAVFQRGTGPAQ